MKANTEGLLNLDLIKQKVNSRVQSVFGYRKASYDNTPVQINSALIEEREGEAKPAKLRNLPTETFSWLKEKSNLSGSQGGVAPDEVYRSCHYLFILIYSSSVLLLLQKLLCCPISSKKGGAQEIRGEIVPGGSWSGFLSLPHAVILPS